MESLSIEDLGSQPGLQHFSMLFIITQRIETKSSYQIIDYNNFF